MIASRRKENFPRLKGASQTAARKEKKMLIFFLGALLGVLLGGTLCVAYLRQEIAAGIGPKLRRVELKLDTIESQLNLAIMTRYAELGARATGSTPGYMPGTDDH
jgi:hypothetical protein